jgi:hypothetical protein
MFKERIENRINRVCIKPIVEELGDHFTSGGTVREALQRRPDFQQILNNQNIDPRNRRIHALAGTGLVLGTVVLFEAARAKGVNLPSAAEIAALAMPALSLSGPDDRRSRVKTGRYEYIEKSTDRTGSRPEVRHLVDEARREPKQFSNAFFQEKGKPLGYGEVHQSFDRQPDGTLKRMFGPRVILNDDAESLFGKKFIRKQKRRGKMHDI